MQKQMMEAQEKLEETIFTGTAGGGVVSVDVKGNHEVVKVNIDKEAAGIPVASFYSKRKTAKGIGGFPFAPKRICKESIYEKCLCKVRAVRCYLPFAEHRITPEY